MKRFFLLSGLILCFLTVCAQDYSTIVGKVRNGRTKEVKLFKAVDGKRVLCATTKVGPGGNYGFTVVPGEAGFFAVGEDYFNFDLYLEGGEEIRLDILDTRAELVGSSSKENTVLYRWEDYVSEVRLKSLYFMYTESTYEDFFPAFEKFVSGLPAFRKSLKSGNREFDTLLQELIDRETDLYAIVFLFTPRSKHPTEDMWPAYYRTLASKDKFNNDHVLSFTRGEQMLGMFVTFVTGSRRDGETERQYEARCLELLGDGRVKGEYILQKIISQNKTYQNFLDDMEVYGRYLVTSSQKARAEAVGSRLYSTRTGERAADFTYPDADGKQVSLSDFKGKVVLVDVWATWCGPCKREIPHLIRLEKEMRGTGLVVLGVSVNEDKDRQKWLDFIKNEELGGIQVFAGGWSKITKDYKISGIPRFMVFDKKGNVVSADAPRPSDPTLKALLLRELRK